MALTVAEIARELDGKLEGEGAAPITGLAGLAEAAAGDITFLSNPRYAPAAASTGASAVIVNRNWDGKCPCAVIRVPDADSAFARVAALLGRGPVDQDPGVHPTAVIAEDACLGSDVRVGPYAVIERGVTIGDRTQIGAGCVLGRETVVGEECRLYPRVTTREYTKIGDRVTIHNGTVVGSDGFGYARDDAGWKKIPQVGTVEIGDDVEIGANVTIDRARFGKTTVGNGVKIDNLVQIAHNVRIGEHSAIAAQTGISGSTVIGRNVQIGGQAGLAGHLTVGDSSVIGAQAGVTKDVPAGTFVSGYPAMPHRKARRLHAHMMRLPVLKERVDALEAQLRALHGEGKPS